MRKSNAPSKRLSLTSPKIFNNPQNPENNVLKEATTGRSVNAILVLLKKPETKNNEINIKVDKTIKTTPKLTVVEQTKKDESTTEDARFFSVVYGKPSKKKHKTWEGDGILKVTEKTMILKDEKGSIIGQGSKTKTELESGAIFYVGGKEVEIISETSDCSDFNKKRVLEEENDPKVKTFRVKKRKKSNNQLTSSIPSFTPTAFSSEDYVPLVMPKPEDQHQWHFNPDHLPVKDVSVDLCLCRVLRKHQREGVIFLYESIMGFKSHEYTGAILADEMGLGKTIQCITLIWTLLKQNPYGKNPVLKKILIVVPSSLVQNWNNEFIRWLGSYRIQIFPVNKKNKPKDFKQYPKIPIMIISYEMLMRSYEDIKDIKFDLIICDEGHRLKNSNIRTSNILNEMDCKKRILLTGTPVQNDLLEFYSLVDFVNPGLLGTVSEFKSNFETSIISSREPNASEDVVEEGQKKAEELNRITNSFILRRTQSVIGQFLPKKTEYVVFCEPSIIQKNIYSVATEYWNEREIDDQLSHLSVITYLKKICNHPILVDPKKDENEILPDAFKKILQGYIFNTKDSSKLHVMFKLLDNLNNSKEKIVIVSNFTQTLDLIENVCKTKNYKFLRFDGSTGTSQRTDVVQMFNSTSSDVYVLLLSSKAGGVGLNLIGGSRLILFDSDWNPATDLQAMARIWREGQKRNVHIYRFLTSGTLEEKIFQRQLTKTGLSESIVDSASTTSVKLSREEIKDLFTFTGNDKCLTHSMLKCPCLGDGIIIPDETDDDDLNKKSNLRMNQLFQWEHYENPIEPEIIDDMKLTGSESVINYIFRNSTNENLN